MRTFFLAISLVAAAVTPLHAQDDAADKEVLERRLRACLAAGAVNAPRESLLTAVVALRSLCYTQIGRVEDVRLREVDQRFGLPEARLTRSEEERLDRERELERRRLNHEIGMAVSSFTGLAE